MAFHGSSPGPSVDVLAAMMASSLARIVESEKVRPSGIAKTVRRLLATSGRAPTGAVYLYSFSVTEQSSAAVATSSTMSVLSTEVTIRISAQTRSASANRFQRVQVDRFWATIS